MRTFGRQCVVFTVMGMATAVAWTAPAVAAEAPTVDGRPVVADGAMTTWSGASVGSLAATDASTSGDLTVLGIRNDHAGCPMGTVGAVEILRNSGMRWVPEARIPHPEPVDISPATRPGLGCAGEFGESVSTDGSTVAVAARHVPGDNPNLAIGGAVYVYQHTPDGGWKQQAKLAAPAGMQVNAVAVHGPRLVMSASTSTGSRVYTFQSTATGWQADGDFVG